MSRSLVRTWLAVALVAVAVPASAAPAGDGRIPMVVLYFDNNTGDASLDVLQKGLADMMVTDLSAAPQVQVVERAKLQQLLDEMKLQKGRYFDPATAQRLGRGVGAKYAVTGAMTAVDPQIRIDVRLVEVASAKVVMADKVVGTRDRFFDLEAQLARRFLEALDLRGPGAPAAGGGADLETVLAYSRGLDAADRGDLDGASKVLAGVVTRAPKFRLAADRYGEILKRLMAARQKRETTLSSGEEALLARAREVLAKREMLSSPNDARVYLGYRLLLGQYRQLALGRLLGLKPDEMDGFTVRNVPPDRRTAARDAMRAYWDNTIRLVDDLKETETAWGRKAPRSDDFRIDPADRERAMALGIKEPGKQSFGNSWKIARGLAQFAILGKPDFWSAVRFQVSPTLAQLDPSVVDPALGFLAAALGAIEAGDGNKDSKQRDTIDTLDLAAQALMRLGRRTEAIARWQTILDRYPTCEKYAEYERHIQDALGMSPNDPAYQAALEKCDASQLIGPWSMLAVPRAQREGPAAYDELLADVEAKCAGDPRFQPMAAVFYFGAANVALATGACDFARAAAGKMGTGQYADALAPKMKELLAEKCR